MTKTRQMQNQGTGRPAYIPGDDRAFHTKENVNLLGQPYRCFVITLPLGDHQIRTVEMSTETCAALATAGAEARNTGVMPVGPGYLWTLRRVHSLLGQRLPE